MHDFLLALTFIAMILTPCVVTMFPDKEEC
jgi:hypothetical protein